MSAEQYIYQAMSVHLREKEMLSKTDVEKLTAAEDVYKVYSILGEKGWNTADLTPADADRLLIAQENRTWDLVESLIGDLAPFNVLRCGNDYHNLKAAIKLVYSDDLADTEKCFVKGVIDTAVILDAAKSRSFSMLPPDMALAGENAFETLAHTGNGQYSDMIVDNAALIAIDKAGNDTDSSLLKEYARLTVDSANIKSAVRCCNMGKPREFTERAVAFAGTLDAAALIKAAAESEDALYSYLSRTEYAEAINVLKRGIAAFERWCDNRIIASVRPQRNEYYTTDPMAAFILARIIEIRTVKFILSAKINFLSMDTIMERLRETYV